MLVNNRRDGIIEITQVYRTCIVGVVLVKREFWLSVSTTENQFNKLANAVNAFEKEPIGKLQSLYITHVFKRLGEVVERRSILGKIFNSITGN